MDEKEREVIQLELKYCERCGGLWLRRKGRVEVYCGPCGTQMQDHRQARKKTSRPKLPLGDIHARFQLIRGFREDGGNA